MVASNSSHPADLQRQGLLWPFAISLACHLLLFGFILYSPGLKSHDSYVPGIIDVQIVDLPAAQAPAPNQLPAATSPVLEKKEAIPETIEPLAPKPVSPAQPEISVAQVKPKQKTALKYKTIKSAEVLKSALERLEQKVEREPDRHLQDTIKRLKEQVAQEKPASLTTTPQAVEGTGAKPGLFGRGSKQEADAIDLYRHEVAYAVNTNWAYSEQLAGGGRDLAAQIAFKVMPDGKISDIFFTDRSGNAYLDDSAFKAIVKSSPVKPHPVGLNLPYVEMGLRFGPKGVQ